MAEIDDIFEGFTGLDNLKHLLDRITNWATQANFRDAVTGIGPYIETGDIEYNNINVIPFGSPGPCRELLLVLSLGRNQFDERLRQAHDHCAIDCPNKTRGILFVTDYWDNEKFWDARANTYMKLNSKYGVVFAVGIWNGKSISIDQVIP
jgi:hypothetical protein